MSELVSVIMPVYNAEVFLRESIQSVIDQTYQDWELLVINDCSSDKSAEIIHDFEKKDQRVRYLETNAPSGSPTLPRNIGIREACGRYIAFLDSDDVWFPTKLERQIELFQNENVAIVFSDYEKMTEKGERHNRMVKAPFETDYARLLLGNVIGCLTAVYDVDKTGKIYFVNHAHEDYILWLSILKGGYIARNTNTVEALYRVREHSVSSNKLKTLSWQWDIYVNVENLNILKAAYCFVHYAIKAFIKSRK